MLWWRQASSSPLVSYLLSAVLEEGTSDGWLLKWPKWHSSFSVHKQDESIKCTLWLFEIPWGKKEKWTLGLSDAVFPCFVSFEKYTTKEDRHLFEDGKRCACMLSCSHKKGEEKERLKRKRKKRREKEEKRIKNSFTACPWPPANELSRYTLLPTMSSNTAHPSRKIHNWKKNNKIVWSWCNRHNDPGSNVFPLFIIK